MKSSYQVLRITLFSSGVHPSKTSSGTSDVISENKLPTPQTDVKVIKQIKIVEYLTSDRISGWPPIIQKVKTNYC